MADPAALRIALLEHKAILENAPVGIVFTQPGVLKACNPRMAEMLDYAPHELAGRSAVDIFASPAAYDAFLAEAVEGLAGARLFEKPEQQFRRRDGSLFWGRVRAKAVDAGTRAAGTIWIVEDVTETRQAMIENQAILDNAVLGIAVVENGRTLHCNRKMEELFGYGSGEVDGIQVRTLYPDEASWQAAREDTARDFAAGQVHAAEYQLARRDGSLFWARLSGRPFDMAERGGRTVWLVDDVTARREAADAVRRARDELEVRVQERTAALAGANALLQAEILERRQAEARAHHMAYHDSLTGLPNRALLTDRLQRAMLAAQRGGTRLALMFLDLDRFKAINDSLGHLAGDMLLKEVAGRLCRAVRASDTVARLGGDEFVVLLPGLRASAESSQVAAKIIDTLAAPFQLDGRSLHVTPSIGICVYPDDAADADTLMRHADAAMYAAKAAGRNNYQFYSERTSQSAALHFELEASLRCALANGEFELFYQPIMEARARRVAALEVLLRWRRPDGTLLQPGDFIPILEENGQIVEVGEWVLRQACAQLLRWQGEGVRAVPLSINLSARQFMHASLLESIRRIIEEAGIDPALVEFELTEAALMRHSAHAVELLGQLRRMGLRVSIDDFGTGSSSLVNLKRFPVCKLKIDRAFIRELEGSSQDRAIVAALMAVADGLQLAVVAEGVETEAQFDLLREHGCQYAQGYLFARPLEAAQVGALLTA